MFIMYVNKIEKRTLSVGEEYYVLFFHRFLLWVVEFKIIQKTNNFMTKINYKSLF